MRELLRALKEWLFTYGASDKIALPLGCLISSILLCLIFGISLFLSSLL